MGTVADLKRALDTRVDGAVQALVAETARRLVAATPSVTGRTRANWRLGIGTPNLGTTRATDRSGAATVSRIANAARAITVRSGRNVFVTNALPHMSALEHGSSQRAPAGMVGVTLAEGFVIARAAASKARRG